MILVHDKDVEELIAFLRSLGWASYKATTLIAVLEQAKKGYPNTDAKSK